MNMTKKDVILCDLDGTLADVNHRLHFINNPDGTKKTRKESDWDSFHTECINDAPNRDVIEIMESLIRGAWMGCNICGSYERKVYFLSGRNDVVRAETVDWLQRHVHEDWDYDELLVMRKANDRRPDTEVKLEMVQELGLTPDDVLCILDDRQCVVDMWRANGFRCLQVEAWEEKKPWERQIADFINKKSADIEDPLRRFKFFKLLAQAAKHEALQTLEPFLPNEGRDYVVNMDIAVGEMVDYLGETDDE